MAFFSRYRFIDNLEFIVLFFYTFRVFVFIMNTQLGINLSWKCFQIESSFKLQLLPSALLGHFPKTTQNECSKSSFQYVKGREGKKKAGKCQTWSVTDLKFQIQWNQLVNATQGHLKNKSICFVSALAIILETLETSFGDFVDIGTFA